MRRGVRVLVLDGETTQALAVVRSLARAGCTLYVAGQRRRPLAAWSRHCAASVRLDELGLRGFAALRRWAQRRLVDVVMPLTERSCILLNLEADAWERAGIRLGCGPSEMLQTAFDKGESIRRARACDIAVPPTRCPTSREEVREATESLRAPWVVKARHSHTWDGTRFIRDPGIAYVERPEQLEAAVLARRQGEAWPLVQEYVRGTGKGVFALAEHGRVVLWFAHERLRDVRPSGSGSSLRRSIALDPRLRDLTARLLADLRWHGPAMLEFRDDGVNPPWFIEMNGRFWGSLQLAVTAGADFPLAWLRVLLRESPGTPPPYRTGVTLRWLWGDVRRLAHLLSGPPPGYPEAYPSVMQAMREILGPQPRGTRHETWDREDPWPVVAEWLQGVSTEILPRLLDRRPSLPSPGARH